MKGAQSMSGKKDYALSMVPRSNDAAHKGVQIKLSKEEYAGDMENSTNDDESTAFASCFGSEFEKTTATSPNQRIYPRR